MYSFKANKNHFETSTMCAATCAPRVPPSELNVSTENPTLKYKSNSAKKNTKDWSKKTTKYIRRANVETIDFRSHVKLLFRSFTLPVCVCVYICACLFVCLCERVPRWAALIISISILYTIFFFNFSFVGRSRGSGYTPHACFHIFHPLHLSFFFSDS